MSAKSDSDSDSDSYRPPDGGGGGSYSTHTPLRCVRCSVEQNPNEVIAGTLNIVWNKELQANDGVVEVDVEVSRVGEGLTLVNQGEHGAEFESTNEVVPIEYRPATKMKIEGVMQYWDTWLIILPDGRVRVGAKSSRTPWGAFPTEQWCEFQGRYELPVRKQRNIPSQDAAVEQLKTSVEDLRRRFKQLLEEHHDLKQNKRFMRMYQLARKPPADVPPDELKELATTAKAFEDTYRAKNSRYAPLAKSVCCVSVPFVRNGKVVPSSGSAFVIFATDADDEEEESKVARHDVWLMTNNHVLASDHDALNATVTFFNADGAPQPQLRVRLVPRTLITSKALDYSIVRVLGPQDLEQGQELPNGIATPKKLIESGVCALKLETERSQVPTGAALVIQHPMLPRAGQQSTRTNEDLLCMTQQKVTEGEIKKVLKFSLRHQVNTMGGSSGSPILVVDSNNNSAEASWRVVALHRGGPATDASGKVIRDQQGRPVEVHPDHENVGILISAIMADVRDKEESKETMLPDRFDIVRQIMRWQASA